MCEDCRCLIEVCSVTVRRLFGLYVKGVLKMSEDRYESCSDLRKIRTVIMRSPGSGGQIIQQADSDEQLIDLWLHGRSKITQRAYRREMDLLTINVAKPLRSVKLRDLQSLENHLAETLKPSSQKRAMAAIKRLFAFGFRLGYFQFDVGRAIKAPAFREELTERILSETEVLRIISLETAPRNRSILLTLYAGGFRVSEICSLKWKHRQERDTAGQITVFGKGGKTRTVLMPQSV